MTFPTDVYACDKRSAEICTRMTQAGFAHDPERARDLSAHLWSLERDARERADRAAGKPIRRTATGGFGQKELHAAFFEWLRAPVFFRSSLTGRASLGVNALRGYAACHDEALRELALAVLEWRRARKLRSTYVDGVQPQGDGRVHPEWRSYGTVSGRWSCRTPNLMNLPSRGNDPTADVIEGGVRSIYCAPPGRVLVDFDAKQLEMRIAAYASGDPSMIAACESTDLHTANAERIFAERFANAEPHLRKSLRRLAKTSAFAICYMAEASTVYARLIADGENVKMRDIENLLRMLRRTFAHYYRWQSDRLLDCVRTGYVETPFLGRRRHLGHAPWPPEAANFPIQGGAADLMNIRTPAIADRLWRDYPSALMVAQVHDAVVIECDERDAEGISLLCRETFEAPIKIASSGRELEARFPIDLEVIERWK